MASIRLEIQGLDQLQKMQRMVSAELVAKATRSGINYATKSIPPVVGKGVAAGYGIGSNRVKRDISRATIAPDGQSATLRFSRRPPTLAQYGARPGTRPVRTGLGRGRGWGPPSKPGRPLTALVVRSDGRRSVAGAFMATGRSGNRLVLRREQSGRLQALYGPSVGSIFAGQSRLGPQLRAETQARIVEQFAKGFQRALEGAARGYGGR